MKIKSIETFILRVPLKDKQFYSSQAAFPERNSLLVRITTDSGIVGWGEGGQYGPPEPPAACIQHVLGPKLIGRSATEPVRVAEDLYAFSRDFGQKGTYIEAISAIDIALWDIWGKSLNLPIHALLGGAFRDKVSVYGTGCYYPEFFRDTPRMFEALRTELTGYRDSGLTGIKVKVGLLPIAVDVERLALAREILGPSTAIMVDANHAYNAASAIRMGRALEKYNVLWFEEPVPPEDRAGYRSVRDAIDVPIAGGEAEFTRYGFRDLLVAGCLDIAQPDVCCTGGLTEWSKILALTTSFGVLTIPHVWGSGIAVATALHAIATTPLIPYTEVGVPLQNETMCEFDRTHNPLRDDLLTTTFKIEDGKVEIPTGPGLGIDVDPDQLKRYTAFHAMVE
jgi:D-galactarolactone cycloisomerase